MRGAAGGNESAEVECVVEAVAESIKGVARRWVSSDSNSIAKGSAIAN